MALQIARTENFVEYAEAYVKAQTNNLIVSADKVIFQVDTFGNKAARENTVSPISSKQHVLTFDSLPNSHDSRTSWIYGELKKLPEFAGAIDC